MEKSEWIGKAKEVLIESFFEDTKENAIEQRISFLTSVQIQEYSKFYQRKFVRTCIKYAQRLKKKIESKYGQNILEETISLSTHFGFRFDKHLRKVTHLKRDRAVGTGILDRVKAHITKKYKNLKRLTSKKETSFKKLAVFIEFYRGFSEYVSSKSGQKRFSISNLNYDENSHKLAPKSWLFENLRYLFPKKFGVPIRDELLSWFLFGDSPSKGRLSKFKWLTLKDNLLRRMQPSELLSIDYRVFKLTKDDFKEKGIKLTENELSKLQKNVASII